MYRTEMQQSWRNRHVALGNHEGAQNQNLCSLIVHAAKRVGGSVVILWSVAANFLERIEDPRRMPEGALVGFTSFPCTAMANSDAFGVSRASLQSVPSWRACYKGSCSIQL